MNDFKIKTGQAISGEEYEKLFNAKKELLLLKISKTFGQLKDTSKIKKLRKEIVRLKSI